MNRYSKLPALISLMISTLLSISIVTGSHGDLTIVTPSPTILQPKQLSAQGLFGLDQGSHFGGWISGSINFVELEGAEFRVHGQSATVASLEAQLLPETSVTPSASIGIRDIFDTTHHFGSLGYSGRSLYAVIGRKVNGSDLLPFPIHNLSYTLGVGTGVKNGAFSSETSDLTSYLHQSIEYDGTALNYRISVTPGTSIIRLEYDRIHSVDYVGLTLQTPSISVFNPFQ